MGAARGERLYALVEEYASLGDHRTGTSTDEATRDWFASQLQDRGARVEVEDYAFERYVADARIVADGREILCAPLFYSGVGAAETDDPFVADLDVGHAGTGASGVADELLAVARSLGHEIALLRTDGPRGRLVAINRPVCSPPGPLGVLVAGADLPAAKVGVVRVTAEARVVAGKSATLVARFGSRREDRMAVLVTTPLTGWFGCAGERGTGIAIALELAAVLAEDLPLALVATTGHEIGFLGLHDHLARSPLSTDLVLHLGASLAAGEGEVLGGLRGGLVDGIAPPLLARLRAALAPARLPLATWDPSIPADAGEGSLWRDRGAPVLSLLGWFERFHTPDDVAEAVTSPAMLETVFDALAHAMRLVVAA